MQLNYAEVESSGGGGGVQSKIRGVFYSTVDHDRTAAGSQDKTGIGTHTV